MLVNTTQGKEAQQHELEKLIPAFTANYSVLHKSDPVGSAIRKLTYQGDGTINYHYQTHVEWLIFSQTRSETSIITVENNQVTPQHYTYSREGTGKDKYYEWRYNAKENTAQDLGRKRAVAPLDFTNNLQDKLSYHLQHRLNLIHNAEPKNYVYSVVSTSGSIKDYDYQYDGEEELILPYGMLKTVRFKREIKAKERVTYAWFAPELNYLLVKLYQVKAGTEQFEAQLSSLTVDNP
ncbi:MAG: DUF3108 domain-containing protein [Colwellia sp.]|nr:DUF3108 domain-containing protein [Colwellia sp.]MCW8866665.1 DUF3108 domain-containing protein [Colwellia sp.]MCW9081483.1 DUF3108 domain-containing protein [Colwellia sp.]